MQGGRAHLCQLHPEDAQEQDRHPRHPRRAGALTFFKTPVEMLSLKQTKWSESQSYWYRTNFVLYLFLAFNVLK